MASDTQAMVLAVNWPPQEPAEGQAAHSTACSSSSLILPAECAPTASKTSCTVMSLPFRRPSRMEPPYMNTERSEEHTSELQSLMRTSYAVFCLKKKNRPHIITDKRTTTQY